MTRHDEIFKGKNFNDILQEIYTKSQDKDRQIKLLIGELRPLIKNVGDATIIVPLIKEYLEISVKNDEHIVKLAAIVQRLIVSHNVNGPLGTTDSMLSDEEKKQLLAELDQIDHEDKLPEDKIKTIKSKISSAKTDNDTTEE